MTDGTSRALGAGSSVAPDPVLAEALAAAGPLTPARVASTDLFYADAALVDGAQALDMETTTLFALAAERGLQAASLLIVSDLILPTRTRIEPDALQDAERRAGLLAAEALS